MTTTGKQILSMRSQNQNLKVISRCSAVNNSDAERAVISLALNNPVTYDQANLLAGDFYTPNYQIIWQAIGDLVSRGSAVDVITVCEWLERNQHNILPADLGLIMKTPSTNSALGHYVSLIRNAARERGLLSISHEITEIVHTPRITTEEKVDRVDALFTSYQQESPNAPEQMNRAIKETVALIDERYNREGLAGLSTGIEALDKRIQGLNKSQLILLAARPAMGKTALALNIANHVAVDLGLPVLMYSLEMAKTELIERIVASVGSINYESIRTGKLQNEQWTALSAGVQRLKDKPLYIDDTAGLTLAQIRGRSRSMHRKTPLSLIVIDYMQLIRLSGRSKNEEIGEISRSLKELAKELAVPVLCLSQLNRSCEERVDKRPRLSDLRDSGSLEQDAEIVMFIYRDEIYKEDTEYKGIAEIITRKIRAGVTGTDFVEAHLHFQRFSQMSYQFERITTKEPFRYGKN
jgi:replicative DNA helicase